MTTLCRAKWELWRTHFTTQGHEVREERKEVFLRGLPVLCGEKRTAASF